MALLRQLGHHPRTLTHTPHFPCRARRHLGLTREGWRAAPLSAFCPVALAFMPALFVGEALDLRRKWKIENGPPSRESIASAGCERDMGKRGSGIGGGFG